MSSLNIMENMSIFSFVVSVSHSWESPFFGFKRKEATRPLQESWVNHFAGILGESLFGLVTNRKESRKLSRVPSEVFVQPKHVVKYFQIIIVVLKL